MKALFDILGSIITGTTKIDVKKLPTQGYFYNKDFEIKIKKAKIEDIIEYEHNFKADNILEIIEIIKQFVKKNIEFSKNYKFEDLKSIDIVFIFLDIVKFTNNKPIKISYFDKVLKKPVEIEFNHSLFNYFDFKFYQNNYLEDLRVFELDGYRFSMPSIGIENCVTNFLINKMDDIKADYYNDQSYDFLFFLGDKSYLTEEEIDNLIIIFNEDIDNTEKFKLKEIISKFRNLIGYSIRVDDRIIDLKSNLDLSNIWKD
jgi:hypothetical protein